jgi:hypothetical protein
MQRLDKVALVQRHRTIEGLEGLARQIQCRAAEVDSTIMRYPRSLKRIDSRAGVATGDIQGPERLDYLVNQDPMQPLISYLGRCSPRDLRRDFSDSQVKSRFLSPSGQPCANAL